MDFMQKYESWLNSPYFDEETKNELLKIKDDQKEIQERFYKDLEFGTGGLRGIIGAGTNRINIYTVSKATQGLANYILNQNEQHAKKAVAIAYDSRNMSPEFAQTAGLVLCANGIKAFVFDELTPTPELSFAVRHLGCVAGIVITASHNPPEYNGYKVYWSDGGQVPFPMDNEIISEVNKITDFSTIKKMDIEKAQAEGLYNVIGKDVDDEYIKNVISQSMNEDVVKEISKDFKIVYTPLHGTGNKPVRKVLSQIGFENVFVVPEQELPDKNFSTVGYPNPEDPKAFTLALELAKKVDADIIVGTDPDADRVGVVVKNNKGEYVILSGNMSGALLTEYVLSQKKKTGDFPKNSAVIKTIVTTHMIAPICKEYGAEIFDVLTGFKYIGQKIKEFEETGEHTYLFGFEESYGCLAGTYARDKDAVAATMLVCEMAAVYKKRGLTLFEGLMELYEKYGYYKEGIKSINLFGMEGVEKIQYIMDTLRSHPPKILCGKNITWIKDYTKSEFENVISKEKMSNILPSSNVLHYTLEDGSWFCVRPSGTEPKIKIYYGVKGESFENADELCKAMEDELANLIDSL